MRQRLGPLPRHTDPLPTLLLQAVTSQPAVVRRYQAPPGSPVGEMLAHGVLRFYYAERRWPTRITLSVDDYHRYRMPLPKVFGFIGAGVLRRVPLLRDHRLQSGQFCCEADATFPGQREAR